MAGLTSTYNLIASQTVSGSSVNTITFSNIPQNFTDLVIHMSLQRATSNDGIYARINNDANSRYSSVFLDGYGATGTGSTNTSSVAFAQLAGWQTGFSTNPMTVTLEINNYSSTTFYKTMYSKGGDATSSTYETSLEVNTYANYNPVTSITFTGTQSFSSGFAVGTTISIYGIKAADTTTTIPTKAIGGDSVTTDGTYTYHTFKTAGSFIPAQALTADILVVGGGGGGGCGSNGAGGGAGGIFYATSQSLTAGTSYTTTIGAGGIGATAAGGVATQGGNSQFGALTAAVGGGKGPGGSGGSAAGEQGSSGIGASTQTGTGGTGYGNAGGAKATHSSGLNLSGGGGGAGAAGGAAVGGASGRSGTGGIGLNTWSAWASTTNTGDSGYYAGGGGGGGDARYSGPVGQAGGTGGGGAGQTQATGNAGLGGTGGGGGGGGVSNTPVVYDGGSGGSGIVIVRYLS